MRFGGEAAVRTVAPGFKPGVLKRSVFLSELERAKEPAARKISLSPAEAGSHHVDHLATPRLKAGGYGSYAGFADGRLCDVELNGRLRRMSNRSAGGPPAGPPAARWRVANSICRRAAGAMAPA